MSNNLSIKDGGNTSQALRSIDNGTYHTPQNALLPQPSGTGNVHRPAVNTAAVVTKAAVASTYNVLGGVYWSYDIAPTAGSLKIEDVSGTVILELSITAAGPGFLPFTPPMRNAAVNTALIITLAAGGASCTGKLNLNAWTETQ